MTSPFVCPPEHKHAGTGTCYVIHRCRCDDCRTEQARRVRHRNRQKAYGRYDNGLVDIAPVRAHVQALQTSGMGWKRIAETAGVGYTAVSQILYGRKGSNADPRKGEPLKRIKRETAEKLLAVQPDASLLADGAFVSARGARRRLQALIARGWSQSKLGHRLGMQPSNFTAFMRRHQVTVRVHREVATLYDELWNVLPPRSEWRDKIAYTRTIRYAEALGYLPPLAWDDIDNDDAPAWYDDIEEEQTA